MTSHRPHDHRGLSTAPPTCVAQRQIIGHGRIVPTAAARRSLPRTLHRVGDTVATTAQLHARGYTSSAIKAQLSARRWRRFGRAYLLHNGPMRRDEAQWLALGNCGPRAVFTAFTAAELGGLVGWQRDQTHVLVPGGTKVRQVAQLSLRVHYAADWSQVEADDERLHAAASALVAAAGTFGSVRSACGILAAGVQQRLVTADQLAAALGTAPHVRHHAALVFAVHDIAQGAEALSEIDFARLCRRHKLPEPDRQAIRRGNSGRRRYLDAEWIRPDRRRVVVEVDGAMHIRVRTWEKDQLRQNEVVIGSDAIVLRFPSVVVRNEEAIVVDQLRRALRMP